MNFMIFMFFFSMLLDEIYICLSVCSWLKCMIFMSFSMLLGEIYVFMFFILLLDELYDIYVLDELYDDL